MFNPRNETQRNKAIRLCIEASVQDLAVDEASRFAELAVLPEDEDVPLAVVEALWAQTGGLDEDGADDLSCGWAACRCCSLSTSAGARCGCTTTCCGICATASAPKD